MFCGHGVLRIYASTAGTTGTGFTSPRGDGVVVGSL